jgi:hypothetical protein
MVGAMPSLRTLPHDLRMFAKYHLKRRAYDYPAPEDEMGVVALDFVLDDYLADLEWRDDRYRIDRIQTVRYRERPHAIVRLRSRDFDRGKTLMVLAGVHGNEHAGLLAIPEILDQHASRTVQLVVLAPVNPVGAAELSRYNGEGYDINRDFVRFETAEARAVRRAVEENRPDFIVSLHEGPQDATFMFTNRLVDDDAAGRMLAAMERGGTELARKDYFGRTLLPPGLSPLGRVGHALHVLWARTLAMKATTLWAEEMGIPEITLESSWRGDRAARLRAHIDLVAAIADELER